MANQDNFQFKIAQKDGVKVIELIARDYYQHFLKTKTNVGDIGTMSLTFKKSSRSEKYFGKSDGQTG